MVVASTRCLACPRIAPLPSPPLRVAQGRELQPLPFGAAKGEVGRGWLWLLLLRVVWLAREQHPSPALPCALRKGGSLAPPLWRSQGGGWEGVTLVVASTRCLACPRTAPLPNPPLRVAQGRELQLMPNAAAPAPLPSPHRPRTLPPLRPAPASARALPAPPAMRRVRPRHSGGCLHRCVATGAPHHLPR